MKCKSSTPWKKNTHVQRSINYFESILAWKIRRESEIGFSDENERRSTVLFTTRSAGIPSWISSSIILLTSSRKKICFLSKTVFIRSKDQSTWVRSIDNALLIFWKTSIKAIQVKPWITEVIDFSWKILINAYNLSLTYHYSTSLFGLDYNKRSRYSITNSQSSLLIYERCWKYEFYMRKRFRDSIGMKRIQPTFSKYYYEIISLLNR